jgi:hypothetical protein
VNHDHARGCLDDLSGDADDAKMHGASDRTHSR